MVTRPSTKSVGVVGTRQRVPAQLVRRRGAPSSKSLVRSPLSIRLNGCVQRAAGGCDTATSGGWRARGAVNAVPEICSAYSPYGQRCGEFCPTGNAPASASVANSLPKPDW